MFDFMSDQIMYGTLSEGKRNNNNTSCQEVSSSLANNFPDVSPLRDFPGLFTVIRPYTVRFSEIENPTVRFGAVLGRMRKSYGAVRCGFEK